MIKKISTISCLLLATLNAATVHTTENTYNNDEKIIVSFYEMLGDEEDWVAIYPKGSSNDWNNVVQWDWTGGAKSGTIQFNSLSKGSYEARVFYENSYNLEASKSFTVKGDAAPSATLSINKAKYTTDENIEVTFNGMSQNDKDWIAIYPKGSSNDWDNVIDWDWTAGKKNGILTFDSLPIGQYEVRAFFNNSYKLEARQDIVVEAEHNNENVTLTSAKSTYAKGEDIAVSFNHMSGDDKDWIAIYPKGSSNDWDNVVEWDWTNGRNSGTINFNDLAVGEYEVRAFFRNSYNLEAKYSVKVVENAATSTVYETASNGQINPNWVHEKGNYPPKHVDGTVQLQAEWINGTTNLSSYYLPLNYNKTQKILELDMGGVGRETPHFSVGLWITTQDGVRRMLWDSFFNHGGVGPQRVDYGNGNVHLSYPSPVEHVGGNFEHFRVDVEQQLKLLEPNNKVISINFFTADGGNLDNIKLSSE